MTLKLIYYHRSGMKTFARGEVLSDFNQHFKKLKQCKSCRERFNKIEVVCTQTNKVIKRKDMRRTKR